MQRFQFSKANNIEEARIILENENRERPIDRYENVSRFLYINNLSKK